ncbi:serine hydrolase domain-containing protein [Alteromonas sp. KUL49]|uniref:serine hydrolase domain-containing protein n=1 Tax=Alteromonas sp. KUL49 TaxID=2480798 RepID=UPI00102F25AB|nr:serine hydrolase domain-containing protein [Alteromonas sp. KUL49]TAP41559.1 class A beta-lactamase-related serine hydrolase [Alteromonas sp. KUL49]GEA10655.1 hypothetical protein KUL49_10300 [Alteromonas sp. KUL49]
MKRLLIALAIIIALITYFLMPVYQFYAYRHEAPMLGESYVHVPKSGPIDNKVYDQNFHIPSEKASRIIEEHRQSINSPGISAAVAIDGKLIWAGASGWANIESKSPMTTASVFRVGSTSKALTSALLAKLVDRDLVSLDTPISTFSVGQLNPNWHHITPRHLASHMAGIPHYGENTELTGLYRSIALNKHYHNVMDATRLFDESDLLFPAGDDFSYSSLGTVLLSTVIQESTNSRFQDAMRDEVLQPLGMQHTYMNEKLSSDESLASNLVTFYWHKEDKGELVKPWRDVDLSHRLAGGGSISTSSDLVRLGIGFNNDDFISATTREAFWTPQTLNSGKVNEQGYAIGWRVRESDFGVGIGKLFQANHGGVSRGAQSWLMVIPDYNMAVAVNINAKTEHFWDFGSVSFDLVSLFLSHHIESTQQASK